MSNAQRVIRNILAVFGSEAVARVAGLVLTLYVARALGPAPLGQLAFLLSFMMLASVVADLGVSRLTTRDLARDRAAMPTFAPAAFRLKLALVLAVVLLLALASPFLGKGPELRGYFLVILGYLFFDGLGATLRALFIAREELEVVGLLRAVEKLLLLLLLGAVVVLPLAGRRFLGVVMLFPLSAGGAFLLALLLARRRGLRLLSRPAGAPRWREILARSWPFAGSIIMANVTLHSDRVLLSYLQDDTATGLYDAANRIFVTLYALQALMADVFFPTFSRLWATDRERYRRFAGRAARLLYGLAVPLAAGAFALAGEGIRLIYGSAFEGSVTSLRILAPVLILRAGDTLWGSLLLAADHEHRFLMALAAGAGINVLLNLLFIPRWSLNGAAVATLVSELAVMLLLAGGSRALTSLPWFGAALRALVAAGAMLLALRWLPTRHLALSLPVGLVAYALAFRIVGGWSREDLKLLRRAPAPGPTGGED
ncbi:MAG: flippase [Candidatus Krumholzibacteriia bacterium]|nr:flippase [bacterium]